MAHEIQILLSLLAALAAVPAGASEEAGEAAVAPPSLLRTRKQLSFNIMVGGLSGLGKTTTINALFRGWRWRGGPPFQESGPPGRGQGGESTAF